jgi:hypothetical protein
MKILATAFSFFQNIPTRFGRLLFKENNNGKQPLKVAFKSRLCWKIRMT